MSQTEGEQDINVEQTLSDGDSQQGLYMEEEISEEEEQGSAYVDKEEEFLLRSPHISTSRTGCSSRKCTQAGALSH